MPSSAISGFGSKLSYTLDGTDFVTVAQLKSVIPSPSKQTMVDQTNILTPDDFTQPLPVRIDSGDWAIEGVYAPSNGSQLQLGQLHASKAIVGWQLLLADGSPYTFQGSVSEYVPFEVVYNKFVPFKAKLRVIGAINGPMGAASA